MAESIDIPAAEARLQQAREALASYPAHVQKVTEHNTCTGTLQRDYTRYPRVVVMHLEEVARHLGKLPEPEPLEAGVPPSEIEFPPIPLKPLDNAAIQTFIYDDAASPPFFEGHAAIEAMLSEKVEHWAQEIDAARRAG